MALDPALPIEDMAPKKSYKKLLIVFAVLLLSTGGAAAAYHFTQKKPEAKAVVKEEAPKAPIFLTLETFTVNLQPGPENQYLQVDITLKDDDQADADLIKLHMPQVRDRLLLLLSSKNSAEISSIEGKKTLSNEIIAQLNEPFSAGAKAQHINGVFFTSFVIQ